MVAGEVNLNSSSIYRSSPKYSFTSTGSLGQKKKDAPGPGQYGMGISCDKDKFRKEASWSMSGSAKEGKALFAPPGPGTYAPNKIDEMPKWVFSGESRLREIKRSATPGPGTYAIPTRLGGKEVSLSGKPEGNTRTGGPGPGQYKPSHDPCSHMRSSPKISFGGSSRSDLVGSKTPGPGTYDSPTALCGNILTTIPPKFSMKGRYNQPKGDQTPGPGSGATTFS
mmetsp:Transcript_41729/g.88915  ORF Transcript_41729/g.88915 Transcript_41729/m.88915 type:complete len:224 (+) Transcript_41729:191-862(+)